MNFCSQCGHSITQKIPVGDNRPRHVCDNCDVIHYQNPRIITGCLPVYEDKILLCKRAIEPRYGLWTLPAGFMENGETVAEGALRESWEEAQANIELDELYILFNIPQIHQVYMFYRGRLKDLDFAPGEESLEVDLFTEADIPWDQLAFPSINKTLKYYFEDRKTQEYPVRVEDMIRPPREQWRKE